MKRFRLLSVVLVMFSVLGLTSCDSEPVDPLLNPGGENPGGENPNPGTAVFKVDFNGSTHTAIAPTAVLADGEAQIIGVFGTNGESMLLGIDGAPEVRTYTANELFLAYNTNAQDEDSYLNMNGTESSGTLTISAINTTAKTISGTFSFTAWSSEGSSAIVFTNGVFSNVPYTGEFGGEVPVEDEDIFKAKVNGTLHDYTDIDTSVLVSGEVGHKTISIIGQDNGSTSMTLRVYSDYTAGTYQIGTGFDSPGASYNLLDPQAPDTDAVDNGTITVTSNANGRIKGTFTYLVKNADGETVYTVTDGQFDVEWDF